VAIKALDNFQINSKLVWDYFQSLVKLAVHERMQLVWMPGHMGTDVNETANQVARPGFSHLLIQPKPAHGISV
jgi:ribonuclease HI